MGRYCSVYGCLENNKVHKKLRFFRFPSDELRCKLWIKAVGRKDLESKDVNTLNKGYFVCELHFVDSDCPNKYLRGDVIPTLLLPQLEDTSGTSKYTQTDFDEMCCSYKYVTTVENTPLSIKLSQSFQTTKVLTDNIPYIKKLRLEIQSESKKRKLLESMTENLMKANQMAELNMPPLLRKIIEAQKVSKRKSHGARYDPEYIKFALAIFSVSPVAYRLISETLCLPNVRTIQRHMAIGMSTNNDESDGENIDDKIENLDDDDVSNESVCKNEADEDSDSENLEDENMVDKNVDDKNLFTT